MGLHSALNATVRRIENMFPGYFQTTTKRNHYVDFGYPETVSFSQLWQMYRRNGIANAAVEKTTLKVWQDNPTLQIGEEADEETPAEAELRERFDDLRLWQTFAEADRRSMVGAYAGLIFRFADDKRMNQPVDRVAGLDALVEVIPAWEGQLKVSTWDTDEMSETYGKPTMYQFNEVAFDGNQQKTRSFNCHPDRVLILSRDGTVNGESMLLPGYNSLIDIEKVMGAGGEGFWKNAKSAPVLQIDKEAQLSSMAQAMGVEPDELADKMDAQVTDWQKGFDALLMLQGMEAKTLSVNLPQPEEFWRGPMEVFAASFSIPMKILVGSQSGERASTEDAEEWAKTCESRRTNVVRPAIREMINRFQTIGVMSYEDWRIGWPDLTESSGSEKMARSKDMASVNDLNARSGGVEPVFTENEMREAAGYEARDELDVDLPDDEGEDE